MTSQGTGSEPTRVESSIVGMAIGDAVPLQPTRVSDLTRRQRNDLALILEGQLSLVDALDMKVQKAAQQGIVFFPLAKRFD